MPTITEGRLTFEFPAGWEASKLDDWSFYRNQFLRYFNGICLACGNHGCGEQLRCARCKTRKTAGIKAVDILALQPGKTIWLIEIKDYRGHSRTKAIDLADEIALKVRDSLATLLAAAANANEKGEKQLAAKAVKGTRLRVVLHLEQPQTLSRLHPRAINPANVRQD